MITEKEIRDALNVDCRSARGRRKLHGREINIEPINADVHHDAKRREDEYLRIACELRALIQAHPIGIEEEELESVEFVMEQLERLSNIAYDQKIKTY